MKFCYDNWSRGAGASLKKLDFQKYFILAPRGRCHGMSNLSPTAVTSSLLRNAIFAGSLLCGGLPRSDPCTRAIAASPGFLRSQAKHTRYAGCARPSVGGKNNRAIEQRVWSFAHYRRRCAVRAGERREMRMCTDG